MRKEKLKETKVLLNEDENTALGEMASAEGKSKTMFCTSEIRKIIKKKSKVK